MNCTPLEVFGSNQISHLSIQLMDGICCDEQWISIEQTDDDVSIYEINEAEPEDNTNVFSICQNSPPAVETIQSGEQTENGVFLLDNNYMLDVIIQPALIASAPFDSVVLPDGTIAVMGSLDNMVSISLDGTIEKNNYENHGVYFDVSDDGTMWYYDFSSGIISFHNINTDCSATAFTLQPTYSDGSIAVSPDGMEVYVGWWQLDYDIDQYKSILYKYSVDTNELIEVIEESQGLILTAVEVTNEGKVYFAVRDSIYRLEQENNSYELIYSDESMSIPSDALTSDNNGTLYFTASKEDSGSGAYRLESDGTLALIASLENFRSLPYGLSFDNTNEMIICVSKEEGKIIGIKMNGEILILNDPSGYITPIAIHEYNNKSILTNGDEVGLLAIGEEGIVLDIEFLNTSFCSYQPPAADFVVTDEGTLYYSFAAPGFKNEIVEINPNGDIKSVCDNVGAPAGIVISSEGIIYYSDSDKGGIYSLTKYGEQNKIIDNLIYPVGLVIDDENNLWVGVANEDSYIDSLGGRPSSAILKYRPDGSSQIIIDNSMYENLDFTFFDIDSDENIFVPNGSELLRVSPDGRFSVIANGFSHIRGAEVASDGSIYITDAEVGALYRIKNKTE